MSTAAKTAKTVGMVMFMMAIAKAVALLSTMIATKEFGAGREMDVYTFALNLPNNVFLGVGTALTTVVIPIFSAHIHGNRKHDADKFINNITGITVLAGGVLSLAGILLAPIIINFTSFKVDMFDFAIYAISLMFPLIIFNGLYFIFQGVLQSYSRFTLPAVVSVCNGGTIIIYSIFFGSKYGVSGLLIAAFIGIALQSLILIPAMNKAGYKLRLSLNFKDDDIKKALWQMLPVILGTSAFQINLLFNILMAANFETGTTILFLMQTLSVQMMLVVIYSITSVLYPRFTKLFVSGDTEGFNSSFISSINSMLLLMIPASFGFIAIGSPLVKLLYMWGKFTEKNASLASSILALYAIGLVGIGLKEISDRAFYSINDTKFPMINGAIVTAINISVGLFAIFVLRMNIEGLALGYSVSFLAGGIILMIRLKSKLKTLKYASSLVTLVKVLVASIAMYFVVSAVSFGISGLLSDSVISRILLVLIPVLMGILTYCILVYVFRVREALLLADSIMIRLARFRKRA